MEWIVALANDAIDPLMVELFNEQDRLGISSLELARRTNLDQRVVYRLRRPSLKYETGKRATVAQLVSISKALGITVTLVRNEDGNPRE